jgi:hypothetical protein
MIQFYQSIKNYFKPTAIPQAPQNLVVSLIGFPQLLQVFPACG